MMLSHTDIRDLCAGYDPLTLAIWQAELSLYRWPTDCPVPKPEGFDEGLERAMHTKAFWEVLEPQVEADDFSYALWVHVHGKTVAQWQAWQEAREGLSSEEWRAAEGYDE